MVEYCRKEAMILGDTPMISLKAARVNACLSQREAAKRIGISLSTLQSYEKGATVPDILMAKTICATYGISEDFIFFGRQLHLKREQ